MLDISERSVYRLKQELHQLRDKQINEQQQQETKEEGEINVNVRDLRSRTISLTTAKHRQSSGSNPSAKILCRGHTTSAVSSSNKINLPTPQALSPQKKCKRFIPLFK